MGIESDHLVYEYLSRVGDLAQQRQLSSGDRMRLVAGLRDEIDRRRAKYEPETPAAVRRILERIGTPEEVVDGHGSRPGPAAPAPESAPQSGAVSGPGASVPAQRAPGRLRRPGAPAARPAAEPVNVPPHLAGLDELGPSGGAEPEWWRMSPGVYGSGPQVDGFVGGIERPDLFEEEERQEAGKEAQDVPGPPPSGARGLVRFLRERRRARKEAAGAGGRAEGAGAAPARPRPNAFLLLAAAVLVVGAVTGYWLLLVIGWLLPYASRVLRPAERKWAVFGPPGVVLAGAGVWLWGRMNGKWGETLADEQLSGAVQGMWPWLLRGAAAASVLYLVWRARRR
ncbi:hypothetical protein [Streptomyces sp. NPDC005533]|uniref:hypothetical protein n=1 Tax=Streptomyces sp. NPDC005533 TaxID=3364723 RepID=UPI0036B130E9